MTPHGVLETAVYAGDLASAERFYTDVLGLKLITRDPGRHVFFRSGESVFLVFNPDATSREGSTSHGARGAGDAAFRIREPELPAWRERLRECGVELELEIAWPQGGHSLYFRGSGGELPGAGTRSNTGCSPRSARTGVVGRWSVTPSLWT